jgi:hypothetical protein
MQAQSRRTDVLPLTWEVPASLVTSWLLGAVLGLPGGQGLAFLVVGEPFVWPRGHVPHSVLSLVAGDPGVGLPSSTASLPPTFAIYTCVAVVELVWMLLIVWAAGTWWRTSGPGAQVGLAASRHEVRAVLGSGSLRRRCRTIRPDLRRFSGPRRRESP